MARTIKVGSRGSALAIAQTELVLKKLRQSHPDLKFVPVVIRCKADGRAVPDPELEVERGLYVKELERALLSRKIDFALHRAKELPRESTSKLSQAAVIERGEASDLFIGRRTPTIEKLAPGAQVGISGLRRRAFLLSLYQHVEPVEISGDLETRLKKLTHPKSKLAGIVVSAESVRLLLPQNNLPSQLLPKERFVPDAGQGALVARARVKDMATKELLTSIHDPLTASAIDVERAIVRRLSCERPIPVGAFAQAGDDGLVRVTAALAGLNGESYLCESALGSVEDIATVAESMETLLRSRGADPLLSSFSIRTSRRISRNGHRSSRRASRRS